MFADRLLKIEWRHEGDSRYSLAYDWKAWPFQKEEIDQLLTDLGFTRTGAGRWLMPEDQTAPLRFWEDLNALGYPFEMNLAELPPALEALATNRPLM